MRTLHSLEEANEITAVRLTEKRQRAKVGDLFRLSTEPGTFVWGRFIKRARFFDSSFEANLVYIYDAVGAEQPSPQFLKPTNLLTGPAVVNNLGWTRGYWQIVKSEPVGKDDVLDCHLFVRMAATGSREDFHIVDEEGHNVRNWQFWKPLKAERLMQAGFSNFNYIDWLVRGLLEARGIVARR